MTFGYNDNTQHRQHTMGRPRIDLKEALILHQAVTGISKLFASMIMALIVFFLLRLEVPDTTDAAQSAWFRTTE